MPLIDRIDHEIKLSRNVNIQLRKAVKLMGLVQLPILSKQLNITAEPIQNVCNFHDMHLVETYAMVRPGTKTVAVALVNNTGEKVTIKKGTKVGQLKAANVVPPCLVPHMSMDENILRYTQGMNRQTDVPEYKNAGAPNTHCQLPPKPKLIPE